MNERLIPRRPTGNTAQALRIWALLFLAIGIVGRSIFELRLLGMSTLSGEELLKYMETSDTAMIYATAAIVMQVLMTCAVPLFAFLLVEGVQHTSSFRNYFLRVAGLALVAEIPYDLAMYSSGVFYWGEQNPVFGLLVSMVMIYLYKYYSGKSVKNVLIKVLVFFFATLWVQMLRVSEGLPIIWIVTALWFSRKKLGRQVFVGAIVTCLCIILGVENMRYLAAPMVFLMIFRYNGEPGEGMNKAISYGVYPALLLAVWLVGKFLI